MTRCLSCEIHVLYRIVLRFTKEAWLAGCAAEIMKKFQDTHSAFVRWETPSFTEKRKAMKGGVATIIIDRLLPNQQKRTVMAFANGFKKDIDPEDIDEGFIEIHTLSDVVELINWEIMEEPKCKTKKKPK